MHLFSRYRVQKISSIVYTQVNVGQRLHSQGYLPLKQKQNSEELKKEKKKKKKKKKKTSQLTCFLPTCSLHVKLSRPPRVEALQIKLTCSVPPLKTRAWLELREDRGCYQNTAFIEAVALLGKQE